jgi:hypothetical protein
MPDVTKVAPNQQANIYLSTKRGTRIMNQVEVFFTHKRTKSEVMTAEFATRCHT